MESGYKCATFRFRTPPKKCDGTFRKPWSCFMLVECHNACGCHRVNNKTYKNKTIRGNEMKQ